MKNVIEADFFPRKSDAGFSPASPIKSPAVKKKRRILIVDNDRDSKGIEENLPAQATGRDTEKNVSKSARKDDLAKEMSIL